MEELLAILNEKAGLVRDILAETARQRALIGEKDAEGLAASLQARQALMDRVTGLDTRILKLGGSHAISRHREAVRTHEGIQELLQKTIEQDNENRKGAEELLSTLAAGIRETNAEKSLLAYRQPSGSGNMFINRKG